MYDAPAIHSSLGGRSERSTDHPFSILNPVNGSGMAGLRSMGVFLPHLRNIEPNSQFTFNIPIVT